MRKRTDRVGETRTMNNGMQATIIDYRNAANIDVEFEDGAVRKGVPYHSFRHGLLLPDGRDYKRVNHLGEKCTMKNGLEGTIIAWRSATDIDVEFEDGRIVTNRGYREFKLGTISQSYESRIGEKNIMSNGMEARIIAYRKAIDIDVEFEDGTIVEHCSYDRFKVGRIYHPDYPNPYAWKDRTGEKRTMNNGLVAEIIRYGNNRDLDVRFEDGVVVEHRSYERFKQGMIRKPKQ